MNIFNLTEEFLSLISEIEDNEGELTPELEERLEVNQNNFESKLRNYRYVVLMLNSDINLIDDEVSRLLKLKESKSKTIDRLKNVMLQSTILLGEDGKSGNKKLNFSDFKLWTVNKQSVEIDENEVLDNKYLKLTVSNINGSNMQLIKKEFPDAVVKETPNKTLIKEDIELGVELKAAKLVTKPYIVIK
jgi:hypothetical protein